ncbi:flavin reductase family protein [Planktotalea sp.]|uniref:flavin reductase family protein n=1 Tax=Planktotalea sp. TaxID=2029877 RepID=UPI0032994A96
MTVKDNETKIDPRALRDVLGCFATGVAVVTSVGDEGKPVGMTINSFSSVSLDPPLVLWSIGLETPSRSAYAAHPSFAINIMCAQSKELSLHFARPSEDKFAGIDWRPGIDGVPVLDAALATFECTVEDRIVSGDHEIFIGRVMSMGQREADPLLFHRGKFAHLGELV